MPDDRPYVTFAEVKAKITIPEVLSELGIIDRFRQHEDALVGVCPLPFHAHGPKPNDRQFKINCKDDIWLWHCFGDCQRGGDVIEFVKAMTGLSNAHVRFWFADRFADRLTTKKRNRSKSKTGSSDSTEPAGKQVSAGQVDPAAATPSHVPPLQPLRFQLHLDASVPYLKDRGLSEETITRYGLGLCQRGTLAGYVAMPVYAWPYKAETNPIGYIGRLPQDDGFSDAMPRYKVPKGLETSRIVYGLREAMEYSDESQPLIVVEGPFKVFYLAQAGFPNAVSTLTASVSEEQAVLLAATKRPVILLFDGDEAGIAGTRRAAGRLITKCFVRAIKLTDGVEPDSLSPTELRRLVA